MIYSIFRTKCDFIYDTKLFEHIHDCKIYYLNVDRRINSNHAHQKETKKTKSYSY